MPSERRGAIRAGAGLLMLWALGARAEPWLAPGNEAIRHDIQILADAGVLRGPVTSWPLSWPDIARDVLGASDDQLDEQAAAALLRVRRHARRASAPGFTGLGLAVSATNAPSELRGFGTWPRDVGELGIKAGWMNSRVAVNASAAFVVDPEDDKAWRADGSYVGVNAGNFMISAGYMERWWGPGWDGSLILSTNARPIPSITLERNYTDPFETKLLSWLGHWRASIAVGRMESHDIAVPDVRFLAARFNFRPRSWLEFALTRSAQFCGGDRECGWSQLGNLLIGRDNRSDDLSAEDEPGNQMAGYDLRLSSPWRRLPAAVYMQWIGEDEAGGLPSKFMGLAGVETWFTAAGGGMRVRAEFTDTTCSFTREAPDFNCGYRNTLYPQAYTYRGRVIGHSMDNDSRMYALGGTWVSARGDSIGLSARRVELNRDGGPHLITAVPRRYEDVELRYMGTFRIGTLHAGLATATGQVPAGWDSHTRAFVTWQQGF